MKGFIYPQTYVILRRKMSVPVVIRIEAGEDEYDPAALAYATIVTEPNDPRVIIQLAAFSEQYSNCRCNFCTTDFDEFMEFLNETIEHEFVHVIGMTCNEKVTRRFERAGAWARGWMAVL